jgi:hypothetical protein
MRKAHCKNYLPWTMTSKGEINDACVDYENRIIKKCDGCIETKEGG